MVLNNDSMQPIVQHSLRDIIDFGGFKENFFIVLDRLKSRDSKRTKKYVFRLIAGETSELTQLIVDYINLSAGGLSAIGNGSGYSRNSCCTSRFS